MNTMVFLFTFGLTIIFATVFFATKRAEGAFKVPVVLIGALGVFLYVLVWDVESEYEVRKEVSADSCEIARTDRDVYVRCGELSATSSKHYIYENLESSQDVKIYRVKEKDIFGTEGTKLEIQ